jgi:hypothetical protein
MGKIDGAMSSAAQPGPWIRPPQDWPGRLTTLVLFLAVVGQALFLTRDYLLPWGEKIWTLRTQPPWERSARLAVWVGDDDVDFIQFLREDIPPDSEVIFFESTGLFSLKSPLQYLLFPRRISVCDLASDRTCLAGAEQSGAYFVVVHGRPLPGEIPPGWRFVPFENGRGYYRP